MAALEAAFERHMQRALIRGVHAFALFLVTRGLYTLAESQLVRSLQAAQALEDITGQAAALLHLGKIAEQRGNYGQAQVYWQDGLSLARQHRHRSSAAQMLRELGGLAWVQGQFEQAQQFLDEALICGISGRAPLHSANWASWHGSRDDWKRCKNHPSWLMDWLKRSGLQPFGN